MYRRDEKMPRETAAERNWSTRVRRSNQRYKAECLSLSGTQRVNSPVSPEFVRVMMLNSSWIRSLVEKGC